jgi:TetR/AcrR family transcriptional repressor of lmrAB and yxaGH operons
MITKGERTKKKLVDAAASLLRRQGYHATGLSSIVDESGAPRGSVYFYFPGGKDELAVAALEASGVEWRARVEAAVADAPDIPSAIDAVVKLLADDLVASDYENGCPVAAVALESTSEVVRAAVQRHYARWRSDIVDRAVHYGMLKATAERLATIALSAIEGALLLAKVHRSTEPLYTVGAALRAMAAR